jgi:hypothetical protein
MDRADARDDDHAVPPLTAKAARDENAFNRPALLTVKQPTLKDKSRPQESVITPTILTKQLDVDEGRMVPTRHS